MEKVLFYHGGPGLNGNPERCLLTGLYENAGLDLQCWDEPSALRPENYPFDENNAFANYLKSAEHFLLTHYTNDSPLILIIYCFSSHLIDHLLKTHHEKIRLIVLIAPDYCLARSDRNIFSFVENDFRSHGDPRSDQMLDVINNYQDPFDENTMNGWQLAISNPRLFNYYWRSIEDMQRYLQYYNGHYGLDPLSFLSVRKTWREVKITLSDIPLLVLYGKYDGIVSVPHELEFISRYFIDLEVVELSGSAHYPHIEEAEKVIDLIKAKVSMPNDQII